MANLFKKMKFGGYPNHTKNFGGDTKHLIRSLIIVNYFEFNS